MKALIFSGGNFNGLPKGFDPAEYSLTIAADKGYAYAEDLGITPDIFVGDFDSFFDENRVKSPDIFRLKSEKDMTDTQEAVQIAIERGADSITVLGALGGRIDHTLANIQLLKFGLDRGAKVEIADQDNYVTLISRPVSIKKQAGCCLSLIPLTKCAHVSVRGVYYPLTDAVMDLGNPYGVSNEFVEEYADIDPGNGLMLLMICRK